MFFGIILLCIVYYYLNSRNNEKKVEIVEENLEFIPSDTFKGAKKGYVFKNGDMGIGYYIDNNIQLLYMSKSLKEIGLNGIAIDMLFNPYKYIVHDMPEICAICHEKLNIFPRGDPEHRTHPMWDPEREIKLDCGHTFHKKCIGRHFIDKNNCPLCRRENVNEGAWHIRGLRSENWWKWLNTDFLSFIEKVPGQKSILINKLLKGINLIFLWDKTEYFSTEMNVHNLHNALNDFLKGSYDNDDDALKKIPSHWIKREDGEEFINWEDVIEYWRIIIPYIIQNLKYIQYKNKSGQIVNVPQNEKNREKFNYPKQKLYSIEGVPYPLVRDDEEKILKRLLNMSGGRRNKTRKKRTRGKSRKKKTKKRCKRRKRRKTRRKRKR